MPRYLVARWQEHHGGHGDAEPEPLATREIDSPNAGQACDMLGWKLGECSIQLLSGPLKRWKQAKLRILEAYDRAPTKALLTWSDMPFVAEAHEMDDLQLLDALAQEIESMAAIIRPDDSAPDVAEYLPDTYLLVTFAMWRMFSKQAETVPSHCRYCGEAGDLVKWEATMSHPLEEDKLMDVYVCLANKDCLERALNEGCNLVSDNRRRVVETIIRAGYSQSQIRETLRVSRSTVGKDIRILKSQGRI